MHTVIYKDSVDGIDAGRLQRLHVGWPKPPSPATFLHSLRNMNAVVLAIDEPAGEVIGFVCGMTDGVLILYIWDCEVLPDFKGCGIEAELLRRLLERHGELYQVNANPHPAIQSFFTVAGFAALGPDQCVAMTRMRMAWQDGGPHAVTST